MFGYETNQKQINNLEKKVSSINKTLQGGVFNAGLEYEFRYLKERFESFEKENKVLRNRVTVLEEIVREAGLVTDLDSKDIKIREDRTFSLFGDARTDKVAYKINKVVTKK
jgi:hypothetical protein